MASDRTVAEFWPDFAQLAKRRSGKHNLLSHQAGLCALDAQLMCSTTVLLFEQSKRRAIVAGPDCPWLSRATLDSYSMTRASNRWEGTLSQYWREVFAQPLSLDFWIGLPARKIHVWPAFMPQKSGRPAEPSKFTAT